MTYLYSYGYGGTLLTEEELNTKATWVRLHPEMRRRSLAMFKHCLDRGIQIGIGTGWRVQPVNKPGFAPPGNSWHEGVPVESKANALAIDVVPAAAWTNMELVLADFHLRSFRNVNSEPWHIQPIEIPAGRRYATTLPHLNTPTLPGETPEPPQEDDMGMRVLRLRLRDASGQLYDDQVYAVTLGNAETLKKLGIADTPLIEAKLDASRAEIEAELGFPLSPA